MVVLCCIAIAATLAWTQDAGFQTATVVSIEQVAADAQHPENSDRYKISMRMGDALYMCHSSGHASVFMDWTRGKEFPAQLNGKILLVKVPGGQTVELNVVGKKKPK
jgi:hypothetical protein